jgi:hypothetical protein
MGLKLILAIVVAVGLAQEAAPMYRLTVHRGTGSGTYACGATVTITAGPRWPTTVTTNGVTKRSARLTFDQWDTHGWADRAFWRVARQPRLTFTMPCHDVTLDPTYR